MAGAYSNDLRERVAVAVAEGRSCRTVAKLFRVSVSSVVKWSQRYPSDGERGGQTDGRGSPGGVGRSSRLAAGAD